MNLLSKTKPRNLDFEKFADRTMVYVSGTLWVLIETVDLKACPLESRTVIVREDLEKECNVRSDVRFQPLRC